MPQLNQSTNQKKYLLMKKLKNTFRSSSVDPLDLVEANDASMMCKLFSKIFNVKYLNIVNCDDNNLQQQLIIITI